MVNIEKKELYYNSFHAAYMELSTDDRLRVRELIMITCEITKVTFYAWLKDMNLVKKTDRWVIASLIFGKEVKEIFKSTQNGSSRHNS